MAKQTVLLALTGVYQLLRFTVLTAMVLASRDALVSPAIRGAALALAGAAVLPAVLILQLGLTGSPVLLAPLRVGLMLQTLGSTFLFTMAVPVYLAAVDPVIAILLTTALLPFLDAGSLLFLLLYRRSPAREAGGADQSGPPLQGDSPEVLIEELEE